MSNAGRKTGTGRKRKKLALCWLLAALFAITRVMPAFAAESSAVNAARSSVVRILGVYETENGMSAWCGTGFAVGIEGEDTDIFVTNGHVVNSSGQYDVDKVKLYILLDDKTTVTTKYVMDSTTGKAVIGSVSLTLGEHVECKVLDYRYEYPDVAVIQARDPVEGFPAMALRSVGQEAVTQNVYTIGYPGDADDLTQVSAGSTVQETMRASVEAVSIGGGVISNIQEFELLGNTLCINHTAQMTNGNSGGPLVLEDASVIGVNTYGYGDYNFSIHIQEAMAMLNTLRIEYTVKDDTAAADSSTGAGEEAAAQETAAVETTPSAGIIEEEISLPIGLLAAGAAVVVVLIIAAAVAVTRKKTPAPVPEPVPAPAPAPAADSVQSLRLQGTSGVYSGHRYKLEENLTIGRDQSRCKLVYPNDTKGVSGLHCVLRVEGGALTITDLGSTYGTTVNGRKLAANTPCRLSVGDKICLGSEKEAFQITGKGGNV